MSNRKPVSLPAILPSFGLLSPDVIVPRRVEGHAGPNGAEGIRPQMSEESFFFLMSDFSSDFLGSAVTGAGVESCRGAS